MDTEDKDSDRNGLNGSETKRTKTHIMEDMIDYSVIPPTLVATNVPNEVYFNEDEKVGLILVGKRSLHIFVESVP